MGGYLVLDEGDEDVAVVGDGGDDHVLGLLVVDVVDDEFGAEVVEDAAEEALDVDGDKFDAVRAAALVDQDARRDGAGRDDDDLTAS